MPGPGWPDGYRATAANVTGLHDYRTIEQAGELAHTLLDPLLGNCDPLANWDPERLRWR